MRTIVLLLIITSIAVPVSGVELTAPTVPQGARQFMPASTENFAAGITQVIRDGVQLLRPDLGEAGKVCIGILATAILVSLTQNICKERKFVINLVAAAAISSLFLKSGGVMIKLGVNTTYEIAEYGKVFIPVMTTALAAQGGVSASVAIYSAATLFNAVLTNLIAKVLNPLIYLYLALSVANASLEEELLKKLKEMIKWVITWSLKSILYLFTGYIGITGVVSGVTDAAALKVTKMTISGLVPVVGGILSDASEAVLVGVATVKNAAGIYGMFAVMAIALRPFVKIGSHYLLLKGTGGLCHVFADKKLADLIEDFSKAMGFLLAMTGTGCLILIISTTCFMKGLG